MQRVVRSTLVGFLTLAALTACGDKVTIPPATTAPAGLVVHGVTVTPQLVSMSVGDKVTLAASVDADAGVTDRTVTWSSSNTAVATVDGTGVVTGVGAGTASIIAASKADPNVKGAAAVTVGAIAPASVSIGTINNTICTGFSCTSVPANLGNVAGQLDVTLNVDPGSKQLVGVDLIANCTGNGNSGADTVVASQNLGSGDRAPSAEESSAPITLSFNTGAFNTSTGAVAFKNGTCTLKGRARLAGGASSTASDATSAPINLTLNNADVVIGSITSTKTANNPTTGLVWNGGDVTATAIPVMYSGRVPASITFNFEGKPQTVTGAGVKSATWTDGNGANPGGATDIDQITDANALLQISLVDANGQQFVTQPCNPTSTFQLCTAQSVLANLPVVIPVIRLDTEKPAPGTFPITNNSDQSTGPIGYINGAFRFAADSAAGYRGPNAIAGNQTRNLDNVVVAGNPGGTAGVDAVTVVFQTRVTGAASSTYTNRTLASALDETNAVNGNGTSYQIRMITTDALGNADTSAAIVTNAGGIGGATTFGVDKTAPTSTFNAASSAAKDQQTFQVAFGSVLLSDYAVNSTDNLSGPGTYAGSGTVLVAQTRQWNGLNSANFPAFEGVYFSNIAAANPSGGGVSPANTAGTPCLIGRFNNTQAKAGPNAIQVFDRAGTSIGWCTPIPYLPDNLGPGLSGIPSSATNNAGYFRTVIVPSDQAGNVASPISSAILIDPNAPVIVNIDLPPTIAGGATATFPAAVVDTIPTNASTVGDITGSFAVLNYTGAALSLRYATVAGPGVAFDNTLTRTATVSPTATPFIKNLIVNPGAVAGSYNAANDVTSVGVTAIDAAGNTGTSTQTFAALPIQITGGTSAFTNWTGNFAISASATTISNCPAAGCTGGAAAVNPVATTITAVATGTTGVFTDPFAGGQVQVWYRVTGSGTPFYLAGTASSAGSSDNAVTRTWSYTFSFNPPDVTPAGASLTGAATSLDVIVIGVNTAGNAVATATQVINLTNP